MGLLNKLKGMVNAVTGGAAKVSMEFQPQVVHPGDKVLVKISATSTGSELKSKGVFVDFAGHEDVEIKKGTAGLDRDVSASKTVLEQAFPIAGEFVLAPNETKLFEGTFTLPTEIQPTYSGLQAHLRWRVRGRIEAFGNDPDTGYIDIRVVN